MTFFLTLKSCFLYVAKLLFKKTIRLTKKKDMFSIANKYE
jgi:hypothetical protein